MLRIYTVALEVARDAGAVATEAAKYDADLARQLRRAAASVVLNVAEGSGSTRGTRRARYESARGSAYEVRACFDTAEQLGYVARRTSAANERLKHVIGALHLLAR
jgi:four helix bundle protein